MATANKNLPLYLVVGAALLALGTTAGGAALTNKKKPPQELSRVRALAEKWGRMFSVPLPLILTIAHIESSFRPGLYNTNERAMQLGGAWGVVAMTLKTAMGLVAQIRANAGLMAKPEIRAALGKWNGTGQALLDPDLCLMLGVYMMSGLWHKYRDPVKVGAAYHSGSGVVDAAVKAGTWPRLTGTRPAGQEYIARVQSLFPTYQGMA